MDIGKIDNYKFYEGFEGEEEVEFSANDENMETLHIWEGYFSESRRPRFPAGRGSYAAWAGAVGEKADSIPAPALPGAAHRGQPSADPAQICAGGSRPPGGYSGYTWDSPAC